MPKQLGLFYIVLITVPLYMHWDHFNIVQVALPTPSHQVPSNFIFILKMLHINLLEILTLLTFKVILGDDPTRIKTIQTIFMLYHECYLQVFPHSQKRVSVRYTIQYSPTLDSFERTSNEIPFVNSFALFLTTISFELYIWYQHSVTTVPQIDTG